MLSRLALLSRPYRPPKRKRFRVRGSLRAARAGWGARQANALEPVPVAAVFASIRKID